MIATVLAWVAGRPWAGWATAGVLAVLLGLVSVRLVRAERVAKAGETRRRSEVVEVAARLAAANIELSAALERTKQRTDGQVVEVVEAVTRPSRVAVMERRPVPSPSPSPAPQGKTVYLPRRLAQKPSAPAPTCVLREGDEGQIKVSGVVVQAKDGKRVAVGEATALRTAPSVRGLFGGTFEALVLSSDPAPVVERARWAVTGGASFNEFGAPYNYSAGLDLRVAGPLWLSAQGHVGEAPGVGLGVRWGLR